MKIFKTSPRLADPRQMDECAMRIKQSFPSFHLSAIRRDLEKTRSQTTTVNNLKAGKISSSASDGQTGKVRNYKFDELPRNTEIFKPKTTVPGLNTTIFCKIQTAVCL